MADTDPWPFTPGRIGKAGGAAGVTVREHQSRLLATLMARPRLSSELAAEAHCAFGIALPKTPRFVRAPQPAGDLCFLWSGPGHWLIESGAANITFDDLITVFADVAAVFDQTDSRVLLDVSGPGIRDTLAKGLPIDLHPAFFRTGDVAVTAASHVGVQIWQLSDEPVYRLAVARSYFGSFWRWFAASAAEFGCETIATDKCG